MLRRPPILNRPYTLCPFTTLFRSVGAGGVEDYGPRASPLHGQRPVDLLVVGVEEQQERVVDDALAPGVGIGDRVAVEEQADGQRVTGGPVLVGHLLAVGLAPADVAGAPDRSAVEVAPAPEGGVLAPQHAPGGGEHAHVLGEVFPVPP